MKKINFAVLTAAFSVSGVFAQNNSSPWPTTGNVGIGTVSPNFNLQLHGTTSYSESDKGGGTVNFGATSRLGFTNTTTGLTANDGLLMRMSQNNFVMDNKESGTISLNSGTSTFSVFSTAVHTISNKILLGQGGSDQYTAGVNILKSNDHGLYVRTSTSGYSGITTRSAALTDNAVQVMGTTGTDQALVVKASGQTAIFSTNLTPTANAFSVGTTTQDNFSVKANGTVFVNYAGSGVSDNLFVIQNASQKLLQLSNNGLLRLRKVRVDSETWADFVFDENYQLMPVSELQLFIDKNNHLPNVPSAQQVQEEGIDLAEMNKVLLQKIEELTLYMLQQQKELEQIKATMGLSK